MKDKHTKPIPYQTRSSRIAWSCPWYSVRQDEIVTPDGRSAVRSIQTLLAFGSVRITVPACSAERGSARPVGSVSVRSPGQMYPVRTEPSQRSGPVARTYGPFLVALRFHLPADSNETGQNHQHRRCPEMGVGSRFAPLYRKCALVPVAPVSSGSANPG